MSLGFQLAGYDIVAAVENWDKALECYKKNFNHQVYAIDLTKVQTAVKTLSSLDFDAIIGGPPCQDYSHAGLRVEGSNADLTVAFAQIIMRTMPKYYVFENVDRACKSTSYAKARHILEKSGYKICEAVINSSRCGVPQRRKRFFSIGSLDGEIKILEDIIRSSLSSKETTVRDYMGDELKIKAFYRHPRNYNRRGVFSIDEPSPTIRGVNRPIPPGYKLHPGDPVNSLRNIRSLTTQERAMIQTFPKNFIFPGSKTDCEQMIGNAVPVQLAKFIGECLYKFHKETQKNAK